MDVTGILFVRWICLYPTKSVVSHFTAAESCETSPALFLLFGSTSAMRLSISCGDIAQCAHRPDSHETCQIMERRFKKSFDSLGDLFAFLDEGLTPSVDNPAVSYALTLAAEEFFTNCVKYNRRSTNDITVRILTDDGTAVVQIVDEDVDPFDVTVANGADPSLPLEERRIGGLGIHISRELLDDLRYDYADGRSTITLVKKFRR